MCLLARTSELSNSFYWATSNPSYKSPKFNSYTPIEWEIWADIDDLTQEATSFWPWDDYVFRGNNSVRVPKRDVPLHRGWSAAPIHHTFANIHETDRQEAVLSVSMASYDAKEEGFLWLKLLLWMSTSEIQTWPVAGDDLSGWNYQIQVQLLDPKYSKLTIFEGVNDISVTIDNCTPK
jgi:hypothetical protein